MEARTCSTCGELKSFLPNVESITGTEKLVAIRDLHATSTICWVCNSLVEGIKYCLPAKKTFERLLGAEATLSQDIPVDENWPKRNLAKPIQLWVRANQLDEEDSDLIIEFFCAGDIPNSLARPWPILNRWQLVPSHPVQLAGPENNLLDTGTFGKISHWINECLQGHASCQLNEGMSNPTRLLDLREFPSKGTVCLWVSSPRDAPVKYAALSHCWGKKQPLKTEINSLGSHCRGIAFSVLPKTFQDAVHDDSKDWEKEAMQMGTIYQNAHVTIVASQAPDSRSGFLTSRPRSGSVTYFGSPSSTPPNIATVCFRHASLDWSQNATDDRAWCFQEQILSTRAINFTHGQVVFECKTSQKSENWEYYRSSHEGLGWGGWATNFSNILRREQFNALNRPTTDLQTTLLQGFRNMKLSLENNDNGASSSAGGPQPQSTDKLHNPPAWFEQPAGGVLRYLLLQSNLDTLPSRNTSSRLDFDEIFGFWKRLVNAYMDKAITRPSDRLVAISSIAQKLATLDLGSYVAGIWTEKLGLSLGWAPSIYSFRPNCIPQRLPAETAPSFSWASLEGVAIDWPWSPLESPLHSDPRLRLGDFDCPSHNGAEGTFLKVVGHGRRGFLEKRFHKPLLEDEQHDPFAGTAYYHVVTNGSTKSTTTSDTRVDVPAEADRYVGIEVLCLAVLAGSREGSLILRPGLEKGTYHRLGLAFNVVRCYDILDEHVGCADEEVVLL